MPEQKHPRPIAAAPVTLSVTSKLSDAWVVDSNLGDVTRFGIFSHTIPNSGEPLRRGYTNVDFTADEKKGPLNPSRDEKKTQVPQKEGGGVKTKRGNSRVDLPHYV